MYVLGVDKFIYLLWRQNLAIFAKMLVTFSSEHLVTLTLAVCRLQKKQR